MIRDSRLKEAILYGRGVMRQYVPEQAEAFERERVTAPAEELVERVRAAEQTIASGQRSDRSRGAGW